MSVRVLLLGDSDVGKSCLVTSFVSQAFTLQAPPVNPPVVIPPEISLHKSTLTVIDSRCKDEADRTGLEPEFEEELGLADCLLVVYDVSRPATEASVLDHWLPLVTSKTGIPIILVGNKLDLGRRTSPQAELMREHRSQFPSVQLALELSTKDVSRVCELFEHAETLVLYPAAPLFDVVSQQLTPAFIRALKLIFRLADSDQDGLLSDAELQALNEKVYRVALAPSELASIKAQIEAKTGRGLDFTGFAVLQELLIQDLNTFTCWELLYAYRFGDDLVLSPDAYTFFGCPQGAQWAEVAVEFLIGLFHQFAEEGSLTRTGLREIFAPVETSPWSPKDLNAWDQVGLYVQTTADGHLSLASWLSLWHWLLAEDPPNAFKYLVSIGFSRPLAQSIGTSKRVYTAAVYGGQRVGRKTLLESFIHKPWSLHPDPRTRVVCGVLDSSSYLILRIDEPTSSDLAILLFDSDPDSKEAVRQALKSIPAKQPKVLVLNKTDIEEPLTVYEFAMELGISEHAQATLKQQRPDSLFTQLASLLKNPNKSTSNREMNSDYDSHPGQMWGLLALWTTAALISVGLGVLWNRRILN